MTYVHARINAPNHTYVPLSDIIYVAVLHHRQNDEYLRSVYMIECAWSIMGCSSDKKLTKNVIELG